jgi:hypothetical protein
MTVAPADDVHVQACAQTGGLATFGGVDSPANLRAKDTASTFGAMRDFRRLRKGLISFLGLCLTVLGLPSVPENYHAWGGLLQNFGGWFQKAKDALPWWTFLTLGVTLLAATWAPELWNARARRRVLAARAAEADELSARLEKAEAVAAGLQHVAETLRREHSEAVEAHKREKGTLEDVLEARRLEAASWREDAQRLQAILDFGQRLIEVKPLGEMEHTVMLSSVHELQPKFEAAIGAAEEVWAYLRTAAEATAENSAVWALAEQLEITKHARVARVMGALRECLNRKRDPRPLLACAYVRYREWRASILQVWIMVGQSLGSEAGYGKWRMIDARFFDELKGKLAIPQLHPVREAVSRYEHEEGHEAPDTLP